MALSTRWRLYITTSNGGANVTIAALQMATSVAGADVCTGGTAVADSYYGVGYEANKAFDGITTTRWNNNAISVPGAYLEYQFAGAVDIVEYRIQASHENPNASPQAWNFEYHNGASWVSAESRSGATGWVASETRTYVVGGAAPATAARLSQLPVEALVLSDVPIRARISQLPVEALVRSDVPVRARLSQLPLEVLHSALDAPVAARLSQLSLEVLQLLPAAARLSQLPLEVLILEPPPVPLAVTQLVTELVMPIPNAPVAATQVVAEGILATGPQPNQARVTQILAELIVIRGRPSRSCPRPFPVD